MALVAAILFVAWRLALARVVRIREDARRSQETISLLLKEFQDGSGSWVWETDQRGRLIYISDCLSARLNMPREGILGKKLSELSGFPQNPDAWNTLESMMRDRKEIDDFELPLRVGRMRQWWQLRGRAAWNGNGEFVGYKGTGRNTTADRQARRALVLAKEQAERASAAKSQFLGVMSHELRTPLNAIIGFSEIVVEEREGPLGCPAYLDYARNILEASRSLQGIISDILDASRIEKGSFRLVEQEVDVDELAYSVIRKFQPFAKRAGIPAITVSGSVPAEIRGDLMRLTQILSNLVMNAIKFTPSGGNISFNIEDRSDGGIQFVITDSGIGIEKKDLERVFEPFFQADVGNNRHFGGTGLGLAIARKIAQAHGGEVALQSRPGAGTKAIFNIPAARVIRQTATEPAKEASAAAA